MKILLPIFILIIAIFECKTSDKNTTDSATPAPTVALGNQNAETTKPAVNYEVVEKWQVVTGGKGERIVIPAAFQSEDSLFSICDKIEEDLKAEKNVFIFGHKDAKSAAIQAKMIGGKSSAEEEKYLGRNFILDFKKNSNTNFHQCTVYPNGVDAAEQKTKTY